MATVISNVENKYIAAKETAFGTTADPFTALDFGHIKRITIGEEENTTKESGLNSGHLNALFEDHLYWANVSIETMITKASLPILLEACFGSKTESTDYTITSSTVINSYSLKVNLTSTVVALISGFVVKDFDITASKGESIVISMNGIAKLVEKSTETLSVTTNTDKLLLDIDSVATIGGRATILNSFNISGNWNITDDEGRGIEDVDAGERRLIQRVTKHLFDVSGSYELQVKTDDTTEFGYTEERSDEAIVFTISRESDNEHVFTMAKTRSFSRELESTRDSSVRVVSYNYEAIDCGVVGDL